MRRCCDGTCSCVRRGQSQRSCLLWTCAWPVKKVMCQTCVCCSWVWVTISHLQYRHASDASSHNAYCLLGACDGCCVAHGVLTLVWGVSLFGGNGWCLKCEGSMEFMCWLGGWSCLRACSVSVVSGYLHKYTIFVQSNNLDCTVRNSFFDSPGIHPNTTGRC